MITIESDVLVTVLVAAVSILASSLVTWLFSRRYYRRNPGPPTQSELEMEKTKNEFRENVLAFLAFVITLLAILGLFPLLVILA